MDDVMKLNVTKTIMIIIVGFAAAMTLVSVPTIAAGGNGNGNGNGGFQVFLELYPNADQEAAKETYRWFRGRTDLNLQIWAKASNVCERMACNGLPPQEIRDLATAVLDARRQAEVALIGWITAVGTAVSALFAVLALVLSVRATRKNQQQETRLDNLESDQNQKDG